ncbi:MAG TPA: pitrilysin family protein, partial [Thermoanaerobaculia bacterium]|nr:pitrilysin family protein [Thermoanaerobaculia bacterium]
MRFTGKFARRSTGKFAGLSLALALAILPVAAAGGAEAPAPGIPARPEELRFSPLEIDVPEPAAFRHTLKNGIAVYLAEDHGLPLVEVSVLARVGGYLDPPAKPGLAFLTADLMRKGGTAKRDADRFEDDATAIAADLDVATGDLASTASLSVLSEHLDTGLDLLFEMVARPVFAAAKLKTEKDNLRTALPGRFDAAGDLLDREWQGLLASPRQQASHFMTPRRLAALGRGDLAAFHRRYWRPENLLLVVAGDVSPAEILPALEKRFGSWRPPGSQPKKGAALPWPPKSPLLRAVPGLYYADFAAPQSQVNIGQPGLSWAGHWDDPEYFALAVANEILGGNLFTSRLGRRLRTEEGLVYGVASQDGLGILWPDLATLAFSTDPAKAARATVLALEELRRLGREKASDDELQIAKSALLARLGETLGSPRDVAATYAEDELYGRPHARWRAYREHILAVTAESVLAAVHRHLQPERSTILLVGSWA